MVWNIALFAVGVVIAWVTLRDVFDTVIVPGGSHATLHVARRLVFILLPIWKSVRGRRRGLSGTFAPLVLVGSFVIWMGLLAFGFGLMAYAFRDHFDPALESLPEAIYMVGSSLVTVGLSDETALGIARWIILGAGFCGLGVMTMAVTYLLEVQSSISHRDIGIIKLNTSAGEPPSVVTLFERMAAIRNVQELPDLLREGRNWCATVRQSHSAHPSLIYFQSIGTGAGWPAALGALLDLGLFAEYCLADETLYGPAVLLREEGRRMARDLAVMVGLEPKAVDPAERELALAAGRLKEWGYALRDRIDFAAMASVRAEYQSCVDAMADHLGKPTALLNPPPSP
jgi:hypothetical protein